MGMFDDMEKVTEEYRSGDRNYLRWLLGNTAATGRAISETVGDVVDPFVPDFLSDWAAQEMQAVYNSAPMKYMREEYPVTSNVFGEVMESLPLMPTARMLRAGDPAMRGLHTASGDVIVPNFYNPRAKEYPKPVEDLLQKISPDEVSPSGKEVYVKDNKTQNKIRKALGFGEFLGRGLGRVAANLINPYQRGLYAEHGISPSYKRAYNKFLAADKAYKDGLAAKVPMAERTKLLSQRNAAIEEAHSQMQQMKNIRMQAEALARKNDATDPFGIAAADPKSKAYFKPTAKNWYQKNAGKSGNLYDISKPEADFVQKHFEDTWLKGKFLDTPKEDVRIVVKKPHSQVTGDHFRDVVGRNSQVKHALSVFKSFKRRGQPEFDSIESLAEAIKKKEKSKIKITGHKEKKKAFTYVGEGAGGVWIKLGKAGTAKVEGGVNMLIKIEPNGNVTGYMSDLHDFLEKVPVVGQGLAYSLPKKVLAVSPPMQTNVYSVMSKDVTKSTFGEEGMKKRVDIPEFPADERALAVDRLNEAAAFRPSRGEVLRQTGQVGQNLSLFGNPIVTDEEQP